MGGRDIGSEGQREEAKERKEGVSKGGSEKRKKRGREREELSYGTYASTNYNALRGLHPTGQTGLSYSEQAL